MSISKKNKVLYSFILTFLILLDMLVPLANYVVYAEKGKNIKGTVIDNIELTEGDIINGKSSYDLEVKWSIEDGSKKEGDEFYIKLPDQFEFNSPQRKVFLTSSEGKIYAEGELDTSENLIEFSFTDLVDYETDIKGTFWIKGLTTKSDRKNEGIVTEDVDIKEDESIIWEGSIEIDTGTEYNESQGYLPNFRKNSGYDIEYGKDYIRMKWSIDINGDEPSKKYAGNLTVKDQILGLQELDVDSFELTKTSPGIQESLVEGIDSIKAYKDQEIEVKNLEVYNDLKGFEFSVDIKEDSSYGYVLWYCTKIKKEDFLSNLEKGINTYDNGVVLYNNGKKVEVSEAEYNFASMGGTGEGKYPKDFKRDIKLFKIDENGNRLSDSEFKLQKKEKVGNEFEYKDIRENIHVEKDGSKIENLESGVYQIVEVKSPSGYIKLKEPEEIHLDFDSIYHLTEIRKLIERLNNPNYTELDIKPQLDYIYRMNYLFIDADAYLKKHFNQTDPTKDSIKEIIEYIDARLKGMSYDSDNEAVVLEIENHSNSKDIKIIKKWDIPEEYRDRFINSGLVAKFIINVYKENVSESGRPMQLEEEDYKIFNDLIFIKDENGNYQNKEFPIVYDKKEENSLIIEGLPVVDESGNNYIYTIEEKDIENFISSGSVTLNLSDYINNTNLEVDFSNIMESLPEKASGRLEILKQDMENNPLKGVKFKLTKELEGKDKDKEPSQLYYGVSNEEGRIFFNNLSEGNYILEEVSTLPEYEKLEEKISFKVDKDGLTFKELNSDYVNYVEKDNVLQVKNKKASGKLEILKQDMENNPLKGVKFKLTKELEGKDKGEEPSQLYYGVSNEEGRIFFNNLSEGNYILEEVDTLPEYEILKEKISFKVDKDGLTFKEINSDYVNYVEKDNVLQVKNKKASGKLEILKQDMENNPLKGVKFKLTKELEGKDKDKEPSQLYYGVSNEEGRIFFNNLSEGKYILEEVQTLEGYTRLREKIRLNVKSGEVVFNEDFTNSIYIRFIDKGLLGIRNKREEPAKRKIEVEKKWVGVEPSKAEDVTINLLADGEVVDSVTLNKENNWKHTFTDLKVQNSITDEKAIEEKAIEYTVKEVEIPGYTSEITGNMKEGFIVKNTKNPQEPEKPEVKPGSLEIMIRKVDSISNKLLEGAKFELEYIESDKEILENDSSSSNKEYYESVVDEHQDWIDVENNYKDTVSDYWDEFFKENGIDLEDEPTYNDNLEEDDSKVESEDIESEEETNTKLEDDRGSNNEVNEDKQTSNDDSQKDGPKVESEDIESEEETNTKLEDDRGSNNEVNEDKQTSNDDSQKDGPKVESEDIESEEETNTKLEDDRVSIDEVNEDKPTYNDNLEEDDSKVESEDIESEEETNTKLEDDRVSNDEVNEDKQTSNDDSQKDGPKVENENIESEKSEAKSKLNPVSENDFSDSDREHKSDLVKENDLKDKNKEVEDVSSTKNVDSEITSNDLAIFDNFRYQVLVANLSKKSDEKVTKRIITTDSEGKAILSDLVDGTYILREIEAPKGYKKSDLEYKFSIKEKNGKLNIKTLEFIKNVELDSDQNIITVSNEPEPTEPEPTEPEPTEPEPTEPEPTEPEPTEPEPTEPEPTEPEPTEPEPTEPEPTEPEPTEPEPTEPEPTEPEPTEPEPTEPEPTEPEPTEPEPTEPEPTEPEPTEPEPTEPEPTEPEPTEPEPTEPEPTEPEPTEPEPTEPEPTEPEPTEPEPTEPEPTEPEPSKPNRRPDRDTKEKDRNPKPKPEEPKEEKPTKPEEVVEIEKEEVPLARPQVEKPEEKVEEEEIEIEKEEVPLARPEVEKPEKEVITTTKDEAGPINVLPKTGESRLLYNIAGLVLLVLGLFVRRKENK